MNAPNKKTPEDQMCKFALELRPEGWLALTAIRPEAGHNTLTRTFNMPAQAESLTQWALKNNKAGYNVYFTPNPVKEKITKKASADDIAQVDYAFTDIDPDTSHSYQQGRDNLLARAHGELKNNIHRPTWIIDSGNGLNVLYGLSEPLMDKDKGKLLNQGLVAMFDGDRSAVDVSRILRMPFTTNYPSKAKLKKGYPEKPSTSSVLHSKPAVTYSVKDFDTWFQSSGSSPPAEANSEQPLKNTAIEQPDPNVTLDDVKERDKGSGKPPAEAWDKDKVTDLLDGLYKEDKEWRDSLPDYKPWLDLGMALHHQFEGGDAGLEIWHHISQRLDNYDSEELDSKYETFGGGAGQLTLRTYLQMAGRKGLLLDIIGDNEFQDVGATEDIKYRFSARDDLDASLVPEDPDAAAAWFGKRFFVLVEQGIPVVAYWKYDKLFNHVRLQRITYENFRKWYSNAKVIEFVNDNPTRAPAAGRWLDSSDYRHTYTNVTFDPHAKPTRDTLNLFTGFPYPAVDTAADTDMIHNHIRKVLAEDSDELYQYIMAWAARSFQEINTPGEVALVFKGRQGTGKGWFGHLLLRLAGNHGLYISNAKHLTGNFNSHLDGISHLFADEALWAGDKAHLGILKSLLTERVLMIEAKYMTPVLRPNFLHVVMASNEDWVVPKAQDDRRFAVFGVSDKRRGDQEYFDDLFRLSTDPATLQAFMKELMEWDVSIYNVRKIPATQAGIEQQLRTLEGIPRWLLTTLYNGKLRDETRTDTVPTQDLYQDYLYWTRDQPFSRPEQPEQFGAYMTRLFGKPVQPRAHGRKRCVRLGTLENARARFTDETGLKIEWDDA